MDKKKKFRFLKDPGPDNKYCPSHMEIPYGNFWGCCNRTLSTSFPYWLLTRASIPIVSLNLLLKYMYIALSAFPFY